MPHQGKIAKDVTIACYGLEFKLDIDDLRERPALAITRQIAATHHGPVWAVEPSIGVPPVSLDDTVKLMPLIRQTLVDHKQNKTRKTD